MKRKYLLTGIAWDTEVDGEKIDTDLPSSMEVEAESPAEAIDAASEQTGFCISAASIIEAPKETPCSHEHQDINDRCLFVCLDCGEELGR